MTLATSQLKFILTTVFVCIVMAFASAEPAFAKKSDKCSANGQKPCPVHYIGPICDPGLGNLGGICRPCGGNGQKACPPMERGKQCRGNLMKIDGRCYAACGGPNQVACPKIKAGYPCRGKYEPDARNICKPCGGDGQKACRALKSGEQCNANLHKDSAGVCRACGGLNQRACPITKRGTVCKPGLGKFDGICRPCGKKGQRACPAMEVGRQCAPWTTQRDGVCKPCGSEGARACRVTDKGKACKPTLKRNIKGICVVDPKERLKQDAMDRMGELTPEILAAAKQVISAGSNDGFTSKLREEDASFMDEQPDNNGCVGDKTRTWTVGVNADVSFIIGGEGELGAAIRCADHQRGQKDFKWFAGTGYSWRPGFGASLGLTFGFWRDDFDGMRGKSHGYVFDLFQLLENLKGGPLVSLKKEVSDLKMLLKAGTYEPSTSIAIGVWYLDYPKDDPRAIENAGVNWRPKYQGWTITVAKGGGWDAGGVYSKTKTQQFCTVDMKCAEGKWSNGGTVLNITRQTKQAIWVARGSGSPVKYDRVLPAGRKYKSANGDIIRYRKNYTKLKFKAKGESNVNLTRRSAPPTADASRRAERDDRKPFPIKPTPAGRINTLGLWDFTAKGSRLTDEFVKQTDEYVILRRHGTTQNRRYDWVSKNTYRNSRGSTFRFVSEDRGIWVSPDGKTVYQLRKRR